MKPAYLGAALISVALSWAFIQALQLSNAWLIAVVAALLLLLLVSGELSRPAGAKRAAENDHRTGISSVH